MKRIFCLLFVLLLVFPLAACSSAPADGEDAPVRVWVLTGPTGIGAASLWAKSEAGEAAYRFSASAAPDEIVAKLSAGEADIAAISTNLAAKLYQKTGGGIKVLAVNTLGVLSVLQNAGAQVTSLSDLAGRKIVSTGQGANPQYILEYLLRRGGLEPGRDVQVEYKVEPGELAGVWANDPEAVLVAPSPVSATILSKFPDSVKTLDLTEEWEKASPDSAPMMGCLVVRTAFWEAHPEKVTAFLSDYRASVEAAISDPASVGEACEKYGIVPSAALAAKAIPDCHLCLLSGTEMKEKLASYLGILHAADPASIGEVPDDGFYLVG